MAGTATALRAAALAALAAAAPVRADTLSASYNISIAGLPIGRADVGAAIAGQRYRIDVSARMTGLVGVVTRGSGQATATGIVGARGPNSSGYALTAMGRDGPRTVRVAMAAGAVRAAEMNPPLEERPDRVPVTAAHKRGVLDPVSALIIPAAQGPQGPLDPAGCNRTLPIFDGAARFDVVLSYRETREIRITGYSGPVIVCGARYVPQAGHRPDRPATRFMAENRDMEAWLAPVGDSRMLMPYRIAVRTQIGMTVVEASSFQVQPDEAAKPATARVAR